MKANENGLAERQMTTFCFAQVKSENLKCNLLGEKDGLYMLVLSASPRWLWCPGEYLLVSYSMVFCMEPEYIRQDISATWEKLIKPTYRAHLFHQVSCTLSNDLGPLLMTF